MQDAPYRLLPVNRTRSEAVHTKISPDDYAWASRNTWRLSSGGYVRRSGSRGGRKVEILLHREILGLERGDPMQGDHINRDRLDNRRENLRIVTMEENNRNVSSCSGSSSAHRGVFWYATRRKWRAGAEFMHAAHYLGDFAREEDAARAVNAFWISNGYPAPNDV